MPNANNEDVHVGQKTLNELLDSLKSISEALVEAKSESAAAKTESETAKSISKEVRAQNNALQIQLDSQKERRHGGYKFKHIGNELNSESNIDVIAFATQALTALETGCPAELEKRVRQIITHCMKQNRLIKRADNSPAGWGLIVEFISCVSSEDNEEEKQMKKAELSVETKFKRKLEAEAKGRFNKKGKSSDEPGCSNWDGNGSEETTNKRAGAGTSTKSHAVDPKSLTGPCYFCKGPHIRKYCPGLAKQTAEVQARIEAIIAEITQ